MTLEGHRREILVLARTGYVVLRIEPAPLACLAPLRVATGLPAPFRRSPGWLGSAWKTESMVTPVFATPILTTSWLA
ncbi:hypothetical protein B6I88_16665 [Klebsiella pneumoniae]|nr:hypothetical protein B6I88_16665 [Klebsiella pneumoniae]